MKVKETSPAYLKQRQAFTYQDYLAMPDDGKRYQVIDGDLIMTPAPTTAHQFVSGNLAMALRQFVKENNLGFVLFAPTDVVLDDTNVFQPDILFISNERKSIIKHENIQGAPDLIMEILSPSTGYYDLVAKKEIYEQHNVIEYWLVDPKTQGIEIFVNMNGKFEMSLRVEKEGTVKSTLLPGFKVHCEEVFSAETGI